MSRYRAFLSPFDTSQCKPEEKIELRYVAYGVYFFAQLNGVHPVAYDFHRARNSANPSEKGDRNSPRFILISQTKAKQDTGLPISGLQTVRPSSWTASVVDGVRLKPERKRRSDPAEVDNQSGGAHGFTCGLEVEGKVV
jgi:hypothetical protein